MKGKVQAETCNEEHLRGINSHCILWGEACQGTWQLGDR